MDSFHRPTTRRLRRTPTLVLAGAAMIMVAAACGGSPSSRTAVSGSGGPASSGMAISAGRPAKTLNIVAGENFWGSIVSQLAGKAGHVTSIVTNPNADPHDYESSSDDARAFAQADYVLLNGAGYDGWAARLLSGNPTAKRKVLNVADVLGKKDGDNPHFWYNPDYVSKVVDRVESDLKALAPADTAYFDTQRQAFNAAVAPYHDRLTAIRSNFTGTPVAATEDIFVYLARYLGLNLISPPDFMRAVAEGNDPAAPSVARFEQQISGKQAKLLVYNMQTATALTNNIKKLAVHAGVRTIGVTETIQPPDATFQQWFASELIQLQHALNANAPSGGR